MQKFSSCVRHGWKRVAESVKMCRFGGLGEVEDAQVCALADLYFECG